MQEGGKVGGKSQPNFGDLAVQQGEANADVVRDQTYANRPTQLTPWGYTNFTTEQVNDPATGKPVTRWTQTSGLTPELQNILNKQIAIQDGRSDIAGMLTGRLGNEFGQQVDWGNLSPMAMTPETQFTLPEGGVDDPYQTRQRAEDAMYDSAMSRINPAQQQARQQMEIKLRNQGLGPEDEAWQTQMGNLDMSQADERQQALWRSVGEGRAESGQMFGQQVGKSQLDFGQALGANQQNFGQAMTAASYANAIRQQQMTEQMQKRGFTLNEINALLSGQQVGLTQMPSFAQAGEAQAAPIYQAGADQFSARQAQSPWNAVAGVAGSALGGYLGNPAAFGG
jgi:hypothetical protein